MFEGSSLSCCPSDPKSSHFYILPGAWMDEPHPWATLTLHDSVIFKDNDFEVSFDPSQKPGVFHFPGSNSNSKNANQEQRKLLMQTLSFPSAFLSLSPGILD